MLDLVLKNGKVFTEDQFEQCSIGVQNGVIVAICKQEFMPEAEQVIDLLGQYVIPGTIDTHVHFRDPGMSDREDFKTGTMTAAAGGVTLIMEHPVSSPSAYTVEILENRDRVAKPQACIDYSFYGAAGTEELQEIGNIAKAGIVGYKTFLHDPPAGRGDDFKNLTMRNDADIVSGFTAVAKTGHILMVHCENNEMILGNIKKFREEGKTSPIYHCYSRPPITEIECVEKIIRISHETKTRIGFAHISTPEAMELVKQAKLKGRDVYLETCPHYLFADESKLNACGPFAKCNPPLRSKEDVEGLWKYIMDGTVDFIGSDHGGFTVEEKMRGNEDIFKAPSGFTGIDLRLPLFLDAVSKERLPIARVVELLCTNPAKIFKLYPQKGAIRVGSDADFVVFNLNEHTRVEKAKSYTKCRDAQVLFEGQDLECKLSYTFVRGKKIMENGTVDENIAGWGKLVTPLV